jgi:hypothetical protein
MEVDGNRRRTCSAENRPKEWGKLKYLTDRIDDGAKWATVSIYDLSSIKFFWGCDPFCVLARLLRHIDLFLCEPSVVVPFIVLLCWSVSLLRLPWCYHNWSIKIPFESLDCFSLSVRVTDVKIVGQCLSFCDDRLVYDDYRDVVTFWGIKTPFGSLVWFRLSVRVIDVTKLVNVCPFVMIG